MPCFDPEFTEETYQDRISATKEGVEKIEGIIEAFAGGLSLQLNETHSQNEDSFLYQMISPNIINLQKYFLISFLMKM